jgi:hypothetical protein
MFQTIEKNDRYYTLNDRGTPVDKLWKEHRCLMCQAQLNTSEHTFCPSCKPHAVHLCRYGVCGERAQYRVVHPKQYKGKVFCPEHATSDPDLVLEPMSDMWM